MPALREADSLGLYVHVPFCEVKCTYSVLAEMEAAPAGRAGTLYFGGGTPSLMTA